MQRNGNRGLTRGGRAALVLLSASIPGAAVGALVVWLGVRASRWLKAELAYQRWRHQRVHTITPGPSEVARTQPLAPGRALVWDGGRDQAAP